MIAESTGPCRRLLADPVDKSLKYDQEPGFPTAEAWLLPAKTRWAILGSNQ
jgi:hypothetical protein